VVLVNAATLREAERLIDLASTAILKEPRFPSMPFSIRVTSSDPSVTDYILEAPAKCPSCRRDILEKTLIEPM